MLAMDEALRPEASGVAAKLRRAGRSVELVLESKKMKWAFKVWEGLPKRGMGLGTCEGWPA